MGKKGVDLKKAIMIVKEKIFSNPKLVASTDLSLEHKFADNFNRNVSDVKIETVEGIGDQVIISVTGWNSIDALKTYTVVRKMLNDAK